MRSTSSGVYNMPTPTPNMPTQVKNATSFHGAGMGMPSHTMACTSTHMAASEATDAAAVCM